MLYYIDNIYRIVLLTDEDWSEMFASHYILVRI